jgi:pyruvate oxidase
MATPGAESVWVRLDCDGLERGRIATVVAGGRALGVTRSAERIGVLDNRCPHQRGPLGDGLLENGYVVCPWHGYEYHPCHGPPRRFRVDTPGGLRPALLATLDVGDTPALVAVATAKTAA